MSRITRCCISLAEGEEGESDDFSVGEESEEQQGSATLPSGAFANASHHSSADTEGEEQQGSASLPSVPGVDGSDEVSRGTATEVPTTPMPSVPPAGEDGIRKEGTEPGEASIVELEKNTEEVASFGYPPGYDRRERKGRSCYIPYLYVIQPTTTTVRYCRAGWFVVTTRNFTRVAGNGSTCEG